MDIASVFWYILSIFTIGLILSLLYLFSRDRDLRKLMFCLGLFPSAFAFFYLGIHFPPMVQPENTLSFFIYRWGTIPIIESFFFVVTDRLFYRKKDFKLPFFTFIFFYILSFILILSNVIPETVYYSSIQFGTVLSLIFCVFVILKERKISSWLFLLSICCFTVAGMSLGMYVRQPENVANTMLTLFSFFLAYIFLALIFGLSTFIQEKEGIGSYFTLENQLKKAEEALYNSEQKYRQLVENLNEGIWVLDGKISTTYVNSYLTNILGYSSGEMTGKQFFDYLDDKSIQIAKQRLIQPFDNIDREYECNIRRKNTTYLPVSIRLSSLMDRNGKNIGYLIGVQDISARKKIESDLNEKLVKLQKSELATLNIMEDLQNTISALSIAETEIRQKNIELQKINTELTSARQELTVLNQNLEKKVKERTTEVENLLKQKDEFINQLGHDLKTPLTPLNILIPIVKEQEQNPKLKDILTVIHNNVFYMKNLVLKTLELAQLNSPNVNFEFQDINLSAQVCTIIDMEKTLVQGKDIVYVNNIPEEIIVQADFLQIRELFDNLISNAIKYSENDSVKITFDAQQKNGYIVVSVKDMGIGIESDQIPHIFDEFYKADYSRHDLQSTGLGLSICKKIIEKHGGKIWVESQGRGKGSTFYFTLKSPMKNCIS